MWHDYALRLAALPPQLDGDNDFLDSSMAW
jgi:hypothetical protein